MSATERRTNFEMPSEQEFTHEKRLEYIVRIQVMEDYIQSDKEWKVRMEEKLDRIVLQFETSKKIGKALLGVAAAVGAFISFLLSAISHWGGTSK